ncbi:MAG: ArnT family glycosyltransferase [Candidatus Binataceae bacterium]
MSEVFASEAIGRGRALSTLQLVLAAIVAFVILVQGIGAPFQKDAEPQSAEWIVSVVRDGNWLIPRDYYGFDDRKPPLYYWLSAIVTKASGGIVDEKRARIVSVVCATAIAIEVLAWTAAEIGVSEGWLAFFFILGMYGFSSRATLALTDMLMTLLLMSAYLLMYPMVATRPSSRRTLALGIVLGLGLLTKGPVVLILAALAVLIFLLIERSSVMGVLGSGWPWRAAVVAIAIGACWYVPWMIVGGRRELGIFLQENFGHFAPAKFGGTGEASRPVWYIVARLIGGAIPLIFLMPATLAGLATGEVAAPQRRPLVFHASLVIAIVAFFSIASAKRDDYILPALPGIAILCATAFTMGLPSRGRKAWGAAIRTVASAGIAIVMLTAVLIAIVASHGGRGLSLQSSDANLLMLFERGVATHNKPFVIFLVVVSIAAVAVIPLLVRQRTMAAGAMVGVISIAGVLVMDATLRPQLAWARSYKRFVAQVRPQIDQGSLFVVRDADFELSFYYGKGIPPLTGKRAVSPPPNSMSYLVARDHELPMLPPAYRDHLGLIVKSDLLGRDGPPALYEIGRCAPFEHHCENR